MRPPIICRRGVIAGAPVLTLYSIVKMRADGPRSPIGNLSGNNVSDVLGPYGPAKVSTPGIRPYAAC